MKRSYFTFAIHRMTFAETSALMGSSVQAALPWLMLRLGLRFPPDSAVLCPPRTLDGEVNADELTPEGRRRLEPVLREFSSLAYRPLAYIQDRTNYHPSPRTVEGLVCWNQASCRVGQALLGSNGQTYLSVISVDTEGHVLSTGQLGNLPGKMEIHRRLPDASLATLHDTLTELEAGHTPWRVSGPEPFIARLDELGAQNHAWLVERRLRVPATPAVLQRLHRAPSPT